MLDLLQGKVLRFNGSILGFEELDEFEVSVVEEGSPYAYLQSVQDENISFLVVTPFVFYPNYTFEIEDNDKSLLGLNSNEEVAVINIVTIKEPYIKSTVNLLAPLVLNIATEHGRQLVLPPQSNYGTNDPLFKEAPEESGER
ncbi:flagellar assembly protein FliW [Paenibacillus chondroitinus]|uniref:Flagellar assembly factor FliW n=1 Tax=Paenibacillus chondroitinus TaxID=59842 RepID=A0ABU6DBQ2_9BACL|nr:MULTISPECIES: flagellar assembly protein FliW [Paenibacillus]MCY9660503.1 flagellar assembly protein FliW [Paenibacillus anseongense]MEB4795114.1 flagellar assembly protein FliW [Paenibacillus chondroitinus]